MNQVGGFQVFHECGQIAKDFNSAKNISFVITNGGDRDLKRDQRALAAMAEDNDWAAAALSTGDGPIERTVVFSAQTQAAFVFMGQYLVKTGATADFAPFLAGQFFGGIIPEKNGAIPAGYVNTIAQGVQNRIGTG